MQTRKKTEFMVIGHQRRIDEFDDFPPLKLNDSEIKLLEKTKSLGVIIDEGLKWKDQYKSLAGKLAGGLSFLKKLKDVLPQSKLCDVYHALFESHIRYGNVVWVASLHLNYKHFNVSKTEPYQL